MNNEDKILQEMRRGTITLAVLTQLDEAQYGYSLIKALEKLDFEIGQDTLYPLLRRLEEQGLLKSDWKVDENRPRRYYQISEEGKRIRSILVDQWNYQTKIMRRLIK
ncbi:MAG: helix-turn-helix transcriptional regulator [Spirochaetales bacterium]|nr:helix-turn-helix transcriptional regulator [Spirochaetales bacterium]